MRLTFVSTNVGKFREVRATLAEFGVATRWSARALPELQAPSLRRVVRSKLAAARAGDGYVLVEDSGLFIPSLKGFPGVFSSFAYRTVGLPGLLRLIDGRPRQAVFRTVAGLGRGSHGWLFTGECPGRIAGQPRGSGGFGFDPIFVPEGFERTFGEMTSQEKNRLSHRSRAVRKVGRWLSQLVRRNRT